MPNVLILPAIFPNFSILLLIMPNVYIS
jgi:hypothetical protein